MDVYQIPENNGNIPFSIPIGGNGMFGNGNGFNSIADLFGLAIIASMFGWGNGGFGGGFGGGGNGAAFLSNQITNDAGRELIMQAVTSQGEASRTAIQTLRLLGYANRIDHLTPCGLDVTQPCYHILLLSYLFLQILFEIIQYIVSQSLSCIDSTASSFCNITT